MIKRVKALFWIATAWFFSSGLALAAQEGATEAASQGGELGKFALAIAGGFSIAIAAAGGAIAQGRSVASAMEGIARNPEARAQMFVPLVLGLVFIESLVIYCLIIAFTLVGKL